MRSLFLLILFPFIAAAAPLTVAPREDPKAILHNPDMGWVLYENYPLDSRPGGSSTLVGLPDENFAAVDAVAIMFSWQDIETRADEYDFTKADFAYDYWKKRGKQIQLRLSTESLVWWNNANPPSGKGVPDHVLDKLSEDRKQTRMMEGIPYVVVDARDAYYRERLEKFLTAVAAHFSKDRPVTLVDLRGFGVWGEWHSGYRYATLEDRRAALIGVIDLYSKCIKDHYLALSYSYDPDGPKELYAGPTKAFDAAFTANYDDFLRYSAFDHALTVPNVTLRRDGAGGAVHSNERKLNEAAFATLKKGPMFCEFLGGFAHSKRGKPGSVEWKVDDALSLHPNYINLLGWQGGDARDFMKERQDLIELGLRTMGYRLVPTRVQYPPSARAGVAFRVESDWLNRAVGRAMRDFTLRFSLTDEAGKTIATADANKTGCDRWIKGQTYPLAKDVTFQNVQPGRYTLRLCLVDPKTDQPIALPLADGDDHHTYAVGPFTIER
ncbi:MAG: hypothetical protein JWN40_3791 [Phycisphaerales bacterium]|nr:hypothetical protein [Phycisphaerales bacterium]